MNNTLKKVVQSKTFWIALLGLAAVVFSLPEDVQQAALDVIEAAPIEGDE